MLPRRGFSAARTLPVVRAGPPLSTGQLAGSSVRADTSVSELGSPTCPAAEPNDQADDYDPFEEFNRSAGIGVVENPYPMFALVAGRAHTIKRGDFGEAMMVPDDGDESSTSHC